MGSSIQLAVDIDSRALQLYAKNFSPATVHSGSVSDLVDYDVTRHDGRWLFARQPKALRALVHLVGSVDVVIGGPPCQGHSNLNNVSRRDDPRNSLYFCAIAIAVAIKARAVIFENVPDVMRSHLDVIEAAKQLFSSEGYHVDEAVLTAHDIGWPQTRKRHFFVASLAEIIPLREVINSMRQRPLTSAEFLSLLEPRLESDLLNKLPSYNEDTLRRLKFYKDNPGVYDLPLNERPDCHRGGTTYMSVYGRMKPDEPVPTITTGFMTPGRGRFIHPTELRTLTPGEGAFVQGFPKWYKFDPSVGFNKSDLSKWIGDAVPLPLGYAAAMSVLPGICT